MKAAEREAKRADKARQQALAERYRAELAKVWDAGMVDYIAGKASRIAEVGTFLYAVEKQPIEKDFCFGYSCGGASYEEAGRAARAAERSADYFLRRNLESFDRDRDPFVRPGWEEERADEPYCALPKYDGAMICAVSRLRDIGPDSAQYLDYVNSGRPEHMPVRVAHAGAGETVGFVMTGAEVAAVAAEVCNARRLFGRRVRTYLKRYGTSKVRAWTYWQDL